MVSSINSSSAAYSQMQISRPPKPDASKMAEKVFSLLDTKNQGFIDKDELTAALQKVDTRTVKSQPKRCWHTSRHNSAHSRQRRLRQLPMKRPI